MKRENAKGNEMRTIRIQATEHASAAEAVQHLDAAGEDCAIRVGGKYLTTSVAEVNRITAVGVEFAFLAYSDDRLVTVPVF